jgi:FtsZ-interacting cell division protein ZipA
MGKQKTTTKAKSGMSDESRAAWRASKSADLGRAAALKKLVATPPSAKAPKAATTPAKAPSPKRAHPAPNDASTPAVAEPAAAPLGDGNGDAAVATGSNAEVPVQRDQHEGTAEEQKKGKAERQRAPKAPKVKTPRADGCLTIAARLLAESTTPLGTKALIETMASRGLWTSPGGKTPASTLYAAIVREITTKGKDARFRKADRGLFTANTPNI